KSRAPNPLPLDAVGGQLDVQLAAPACVAAERRNVRKEAVWCCDDSWRGRNDSSVVDTDEADSEARGGRETGSEEHQRDAGTDTGSPRVHFSDGWRVDVRE